MFILLDIIYETLLTHFSKFEKTIICTLMICLNFLSMIIWMQFYLNNLCYKKSFVLGHLSNPKKHTIISHMIIITIVIYFHFSHYLQKQRFLSTTQRSIRLNKLISYSFFCFNNIVFISRYNAHPNTKNDKCIIFSHATYTYRETTHKLHTWLFTFFYLMV